MSKPKVKGRRKAHIFKEGKWVPEPFGNVKEGDILKIKERPEDSEFIKNNSEGFKFVALKDAYFNSEEDLWEIAVDDKA